MTPLTEVCVDGVDGLVTAQDSGADRVELCTGLAVGGLTPSPGVVERALQVARVPVHVLVRPRDGDFVYSDEEFVTMQRDVAWLRDRGAQGVVIGCLTPEGDIDHDLTRRLVDLARPMSVTFHRAFDHTRDALEALEVLIHCRIDRILTSGQQPTALEGAPLLSALLRAAGDRVTILGCGGLRPHNVSQVLAAVPLKELHFSALQPVTNRMHARAGQIRLNKGGPEEEDTHQTTSAQQVREMISLIRRSPPA